MLSKIITKNVFLKKKKRQLTSPALQERNFVERIFDIERSINLKRNDRENAAILACGN